MNRENLRKNIAEILEVNVKSISSDNLLSEYDWDSLKVLEYLAFVDENFSKAKITPDKIFNCKTVNDLEKLLAKFIK